MENIPNETGFPRNEEELAIDHKKKNLIVIVLTLVIISAGFWVWQELKNGQAQMVGQISTQDKSDNWNIYTNDRVGYSFSYPPSGILYSTTEVGDSAPVDSNSQVVYSDGFSITNFGSDFALTPENIRNQFYGKAHLDISKTSIGNYEAYQASFDDTASDFYFIQRPEPNETVVEISVSRDNPVSSTIFSTFKFLPVSKESEHFSGHVFPDKMVITGKNEASFDRSQSEYSKEFTLPQLRNIGNESVLNKINQILTFKEITGYDLGSIDVKGSSSGVTKVDYQVNYDKNNILSLSCGIEFLGAYPSGWKKSYLINLNNGEPIKLSDVIYQNKISDLINLLNQKLQNNIDQAKKLERGGCSGEDIDQDIKEYDRDGRFPISSSLDFEVTRTGLEFTHAFGFPHVIQACEPDGKISLTYNELRGFIDPNGLLGSEIK